MRFELSNKLSGMVGYNYPRHKVGLPPGTLVFVGDKRTEKSEIELITYNEKELDEYTSKDSKEILSQLKDDRINWLNIDGLHNISLIEDIGKHFDLHPLMLEDILNPEHRPKVEDHESQLFFTIKTLYNLTDEGIYYEQVSFVLGKNYLLSVQEKEGDLFDPFRERLRKGGTGWIRSRKKGSDYLFYRLIDTIVDGYYAILEKVGDRIEKLEDEVYEKPTRRTLQNIQKLKRELILLRKTVYPVREAISRITKGEFSSIKKETLPFFSDVYDHTIHIIDNLETYRDLISSLTEAYMTAISNRMNEVMKVLTIITTIFIPLSFIAGVYGMNFEYMPELGWKYGYLSVWILMITVVVSMIYFFKRKKWL